MGFLLVMKAEWVRTIIIMRRYWFRTIISIIMGYGMLMVLIAGFMYNSEKVTAGLQSQFADTNRATNFVLGFIIGMFAFGIVGMFTQGLQSMAGAGVLEQLYMSPHGLIVNLLARTLVAAVSTIISSSVLVYMVAYSVKGTLHFDLIPVLVLMILSFVNLLGFGFMTGGLVLVFKEVGQIAMLIRMGLFALAIFAKEDLLQHGLFFSSIMHVLPITDAAICLKYVLIKGQVDDAGNFVSVFYHPCFYWLLASCVVWTFIGVTCFKMMEDYSRSRGTLGAY